MRHILILCSVAALFMAAMQAPILLASLGQSGGIGIPQRVAFYDFLTFAGIAIFYGTGPAVLDELRSIRLALIKKAE